MSIELYFLVNQLADFSLLAAAARGLGCFRLSRAALASALAALYATLCVPAPWLKAPACQLALLALISATLVGGGSAWLTAVAGLTIASATAAAGMFALQFHSVAALLPASALLCLQTRLRRATASALPASIEVTHRGRAVRFHACVDTGNHLTEPLSGQPVLIANARLVRSVLPETGYRLVGYGSIGGDGTLRCFRPDRISVCLNGRRYRAPDTWIAVLPHRLPGVAQALAPAEYALY